VLSSENIQIWFSLSSPPTLASLDHDQGLDYREALNTHRQTYQPPGPLFFVLLSGTERQVWLKVGREAGNCGTGRLVCVDV